MPLRTGSTLIGRAANCDLVLDDASVSRWHATFAVNGNACAVTDLGSRNGTFVNGAQVEQQTLKDGDRIVLGYAAFTLREISAQPVVIVDSGSVVNVAACRSIAESPAADDRVDRQRLLQMLTDISRTLVGTLPVDTVLGRVVDLAFSSTDAERVLLLLWNHAAGELVPRIVRQRQGVDLPATISRTIVERAMTERVSMLAVDTQSDPGLAAAPSVASLHTRSFMSAPLWYEEEIIGLLYVDNPVNHSFTETDLDLFTAFSNYAAVAIAQARLSEQVQMEIKRRGRLERYHSPSVVERLLTSEANADGELPMMAQERDVTVLLADLVGFTTMAERLPAQQVAVLLNVFFSRMVDVVFAERGTLDKFLGDAVLVIFGAPVDLPNHALSAVHAAQRMQQALVQLNQERGEPRLAMRIAIHTGTALVGDIGSPRRREYSVLGDVPNTVARIEDGYAEPGRIVLTRATLERLNGAVSVKAKGAHRFRGQTREVELFEVVAAQI